MPPTQTLRLAVSYALTNVREDVGSPVDVHAWVSAPSSLRLPGYGVATTDAFPVASPTSSVIVQIPLQPGIDPTVMRETGDVVSSEFGGGVIGISLYVTTASGEPLSVPSGKKVATARTRFPMGTALLLMSDLKTTADTGVPVEALIMDASARLSQGGASNPVAYPVGVMQVRVVGHAALPPVLSALVAQSDGTVDAGAAMRAFIASAARMTMADFRTLMNTYRASPPSIAPTQSLYNTSVIYSLPASTYCLRGVRECGTGGVDTAREAAFLRQQIFVASAEHGLSEAQFSRAAAGANGPLQLTLASQIIVRAASLYVLSLPYVSERASYSRTPPAGTTSASGANLLASGAVEWVSKGSIATLTRAVHERGRMSTLRDYFDSNLSASGEPDCEDGARWAHDVLWVMHGAGRVAGGPDDRSATPLQSLISSGEAGDALRSACRLVYATSVPAIGFYAAASASASGAVAADGGGGGSSYASHQAVELHSVPAFVAMLPTGTVERYPGVDAALRRAHAYPSFGSGEQPPYAILHGETTGSATENFMPIPFLPHDSPEAVRDHLSAFIDEGRFVNALSESGARSLLDMNVYGPPNMRDAHKKQDIIAAESSGKMTLSSFKIKTTSLMTPWVRETTGRYDAAAKFDFVTVHEGGTDDNAGRRALSFDQRTATFGASVASTVVSGLRGDTLPFAVKLIAHDGIAGPSMEDGLGVLPSSVCALTVADPPSMLPRLNPGEVGMSGAPPRSSPLRPLYESLIEFDTTRRGSIPTLPGTPMGTPVPMLSPYYQDRDHGRILLWCSERAPPKAEDVQRALTMARANVPALSGIQVTYAPLVASDVRVGASGGLAMLCLTLRFDRRKL